MPFLSGLCLPWVSQGELHKYCAAENEAEDRVNSQSQKASVLPSPQLPANGTDCGWAPFGEFSVPAALKRTVPTGRVLPRRALGYAGVTTPPAPPALLFQRSAHVLEGNCVQGADLPQSHSPSRCPVTGPVCRSVTAEQRSS